MTSILNSEGIQRLSAWDFPDTVHVPNGYNERQVAEATRENFQVLMEKVNEVIDVVNRLDRGHSGLLDALSGDSHC